MNVIDNIKFSKNTYNVILPNVIGSSKNTNFEIEQTLIKVGKRINLKTKNLYYGKLKKYAFLNDASPIKNSKLFYYALNFFWFLN